MQIKIEAFTCNGSEFEHWYQLFMTQLPQNVIEYK